MSYKTFVRMVSVAGIIIAILLVMGIRSCFSGRPAHLQSVAAPISTPPPVTVPAPPPAASLRVDQRAKVSQKEATGKLTPDQLRVKLESWLNEHGRRRGRSQWKNIMPDESFLATALRFPESDAVKWSDDPDQWSQIRFDFDRDGIDDEKWLLKNGHTWKREVLDKNNKVTFTEYFDK